MEDSLHPSFHPGFNAAYDLRYIFCFDISPILSPILLCIVPSALLATLATIAQGKHAESSRCTGRLNAHCGFVGNSDFYGLGIRLGVYMQWLASLIAYASLPGERRGLACGYAIFSFALAIALLILAFQKECTFEAEVIVVLFIFFGGVLNVLAPLVGTPDMVGAAVYGIKYRKNRGQKALLTPVTSGQDAAAQAENRWYNPGHGLTALLNSLMHPMVLFSSWFWVNMSIDKPGPFASTTCGTSFFLLAHITPRHVRSASVFMAFCSIWLAITPYISMIRHLLLLRNRRKLAKAVLYLYASFWTNFFIDHVYKLVACCSAWLSEGRKTQRDDTDLRDDRTQGSNTGGHDGRALEKDGSLMINKILPRREAQSDEEAGHCLDYEGEELSAGDP
jgi:hypothetical protein